MVLENTKNSCVLSVDFAFPLFEDTKPLVFKRGSFFKNQQFNDFEHKAALLLTSILLFESKNTFNGMNVEFIIKNSSFIEILQKTLNKFGINCLFLDTDVDDNEYNVPYIDNFKQINFELFNILFSQNNLLNFLFSDESYVVIN